MIERKIIHVLSHNVVMAKLSTGKNSIVFGKGIGFQKKPGMPVIEADITQEFLLHTSEVLEHYEQILNAVDFKIIGIVEEVIAYAQAHLEGEFSDTIHSALVDHINFAIERCKRGICINNPFAFEIQHLYKKDYEVAERAVAFLNSHLDDVMLPEDEVAFLAMHFHGSRNKSKGSESLAEVRLVSKIIEEARAVGYLFDNSFSTLRFISHLKALIDRIKQRKTIVNPLLGKIQEEYAETYQRAVILGIIMADTLQAPVPDDEIGFLAMHLERMQQRNTID